MFSLLKKLSPNEITVIFNISKSLPQCKFSDKKFVSSLPFRNGLFRLAWQNHPAKTVRRQKDGRQKNVYGLPVVQGVKSDLRKKPLGAHKNRFAQVGLRPHSYTWNASI